MITLGRGLSKLEITAYLDREMQKSDGSIEAAFNPASIDLAYELEYTQNTYFNDNVQSQRFRRARPSSLRLELLFDATLPGKNDDIDKQIASLRAICYTVDPKTHVSRFLKITWGKLKWHGEGYFAGRMSSMSVRYTLFSRNGKPLRASVQLTILADASMVLQDSTMSVARPGVSTVTAPDMSSLSSIASAIDSKIGTAARAGAGAGAGFFLVDYLGVALDNDMDSLDDYAPGETLISREEQQ